LDGESEGLNKQSQSYVPSTAPIEPGEPAGRPTSPTGIKQRLARWKSQAVLVALLVSTFVAILHIWAPDSLERIERMAINARFLLRGPEVPSGDVVVVGYDEASTKALGRWPVSRRLMAQAIDRVAADGAKTIAMDYLLIEPEPDLPADIRARLNDLTKSLPEGSPAAQQAASLVASDSADQALAQAMKRAGNVLLPFSYSSNGSSLETPNWIVPWHFVRTKPACDLTNTAQFDTGMQAPLPSLAGAAVLGGYVNINLDVDGAPRSEYLATYFDDDCFPSMTVAAVAHYLDVDWQQVRIDLGVSVSLGTSRTIDVDPDNSVVVNYFGDEKAITIVPFSKVIAGSMDPGTFKNKLVIFGTNYQGGSDFVRSPFAVQLPGVVRNATMAERLIHGGNLLRPDWSIGVSLLAVFVLGGLSAFMARRLPTGFGVAGNAGLVLAWSVATFLALFPGGFWINWLYPVLSVVLNAGAQRTIRNITDERERRRAEQSLRESEERYALAARGANDGLWDWDLVNNKLFTSTRWQQMLGLRASRLSGQPGDWFDRVHRDDIDIMRAAIDAHLKGSSTHFEQELRMRHGEGNDRWMAIRGMAVRDATGRPTRFAGSMTDITARKKAEQDLLFNAFHSHLTKLPNRTLLVERTEQALQLWAKDSTSDVVVAILDIDRFGHYNETLGQKVGDDILITLARSLEEQIRPEDTLAHLGEDEYAITRFIAGNVEEGVEELIVMLKTVLGQHMEIGGRPIEIEASIGYVLASQSAGAVGDELLRDANLALYRAKAQGRGQVVRFEPSMHQSAMKRFGLEADMKRAITAGDQFELFYQPIIALDDGHLHGFEALIRWRHPERGLISPVDFIPLAEDTDMIIDIGRKSIMDAARQIAAWMPADGDPPQIAVNVSGKQFAAVGLVDDIERALKVTGIPPHALKLEITESLIMDNPERTNEVLRRIIALGCKVSIDDFGTGYSSLSHLHRFPFHTLKVDRSFVMRINDSREGLEIVRVISSLAHILERDVVAEGVETEEQATELRRLGIQFGQGYMFAKPLPAGEASVFLARNRAKFQR
jgi:diguanylate cyclase (GGDEF)-like protein/PAS domain S-box-containing protein